MAAPAHPLHVSLVALPDAALSTLTGIYDVLTSFALLATISDTIPRRPPFAVELVGEGGQPVLLAGDVPLPVHKSIEDIESTNIVILPALLVKNAAWVTGQHPALVAWLKAMHEQGSVLCSACSGVFVLAETGLLDRRDATIHWTYAAGFARLFPDVRLDPERVLVEAGDKGQFLMSGASTSWHDLVLYLIARHAGATTAQAIARFFAMQWHNDGLAPYVVFNPPMDHDDSTVKAAQNWLATHFSVATPVDDMVRRSALPERSFKRRFTRATGLAPISYVQQLRIEDAKRRLERTDDPIDEIAWKVGYEDPAFFRRLFKRVTGITPGTYRRRFQVPDFGS